ncbi:hypothetical protein JL720_9160 [Aureococcus anophagefferens]|nr:hypothetical protein JL720_9160 [Aureococcus anophagefferens]
MDAIASIFVNYHEERRELVEKTEAADLIEQNLLIQFVVLPRKMGTGRDSLEVRDPRPGLAPRAPKREADGSVPAQTDENVVTCFIDGAATLKRARKQGLLRPVAPRPFARALQFDFVLMLCRRLGVKDVFLFATEAGAPAWLTLGFEHVGSSASLIHLRFDLLFKRDRGVLASPAVPGAATAAARWTALKIFSDSAGLYPMRDLLAAPSPPRASSAPAPAAPSPSALATLLSPPPAAPRRRRRRGREPLEAAPPAPAPRRRAAASKKRVVDDADADDEDEAWEPGRPSMMDLDDDEQEQAAKAKRKLKRRSKKKSAKAKNAAGAAPHAPLSEVQKARLRMKDQEHIRRAARLHEAVTQEQERNAFLERIQAEEVRREQARIAAARPVPPPPNRATGAGDDSDEGWEESDEDDPVEDLIHRERIRERDLRTPGCLALGRKAFRLEDMPRVTERDREILRRVLYILREAERRNCGELEVPRPREWALSDFGDTMTTEAIRARFDLRRLQRLFPNLDFRLSWSVRFNVFVQTIDAIALDSNLELTRVDMEVRRSTVGVYEDSLACQLLGQTYYVHPDKTIKITVDLVVTSEVIGAFPRTAPGRAEVQIKELGFHFIDPLAPIAEKEIATLVADGAKKVSFHYQNGKAKTGANGSEYLVERWRGLAETDPLRLEFDELARCDVAAAAADELPVDRLQRVPDPGLVNLPTIWPRMRFSFRVATSRRRATEAFSRVQEALRSLENAFAEFMPERFYGITDNPKDGCPKGKVLARAQIPGGRNTRITFGLYDSKVEVSIQEKHRISEVVVARIEEHNVERAEAEKPLPPLHVAGASRRLERYKADFALQLKDLAYVEAADEAYLRDQAAALAPPEPMPDGSRPPIDAHSRRVARGLAALERMIERRRERARGGPGGTPRPVLTMIFVTRPPHADRRVHRRRRELLPRPVRPPRRGRRAARPAARVAKLYVVPNCEVVTPPPPPIYHVTENGERLLVLYAACSGR